MFNSPIYTQKIGYDNAAAVAKKAHKEGTTLKVIIAFVQFALFPVVLILQISCKVMCAQHTFTSLLECENFLFLLDIKIS
jgi:hypothetical protein